MSFFSIFLTIAIIHLLGAMLPGPDFALVSQHSLLSSRRAGIFTALGLALGIMVHITYSLVGIGLIIAKSIVLFSIIKFLGAGYLIYIGYKSIKSKQTLENIKNDTPAIKITDRQAIQRGFLSNVLNPKVTLMFLSIFTQVISPQTPLPVELASGIEMVIMTFLWFALVATILSAERIKERFRAVQTYAEKMFGAVLIVLGIKVALSTRK